MSRTKKKSNKVSLSDKGSSDEGVCHSLFILYIYCFVFVLISVFDIKMCVCMLPVRYHILIYYAIFVCKYL